MSARKMTPSPAPSTELDPALRAAVKAAIDALDPEELLCYGNDEYDLEVDDFTRAVMRGEDMTPDAVRARWARWFGDDESREASDRSRLAVVELAGRLAHLERDR